MTSILDKDIVQDYDEEAEDLIRLLKVNIDVDFEQEVSLCLE